MNRGRVNLWMRNFVRLEIRSQGSFHISVDEPSPSFLQAPPRKRSLVYKIPFQIAESKIFLRTSGKEEWSQSFAVKMETHNFFSLLRSCHPNLDNKALFISSILLKPNPPTGFDRHIIPCLEVNFPFILPTRTELS